MLKERGTQGLGEWLKKLAEREHWQRTVPSHPTQNTEHTHTHTHTHTHAYKTHTLKERKSESSTYTTWTITQCNTEVKQGLAKSYEVFSFKVSRDFFKGAWGSEVTTL
jgi:hypothetical protein